MISEHDSAEASFVSAALCRFSQKRSLRRLGVRYKLHPSSSARIGFHWLWLRPLGHGYTVLGIVQNASSKVQISKGMSWEALPNWHFQMDDCIGWHALPHSTPFGFRMSMDDSLKTPQASWSRGGLPDVGSNLTVHGSARRAYDIQIVEIPGIELEIDVPQDSKLMTRGMLPQGHQDGYVFFRPEIELPRNSTSPSTCNQSYELVVPDFLSCAHLPLWNHFRETLLRHDKVGSIISDEAVAIAWKLIRAFGITRLHFSHFVAMSDESYEQLHDSANVVEKRKTEHCPFGIVLALHVAYAHAKRINASGEDVAHLNGALSLSLNVLLQSGPVLAARSTGSIDLPETWHHDWSLDFLDSANWSVNSSWDVLVNFQSSTLYDYKSYASTYPVYAITFKTAMKLAWPASLCRLRSDSPLALRPIVFCSTFAMAREHVLELRAALPGKIQQPRMIFMEGHNTTSCLECRAGLDGRVPIDRRFLYDWRDRQVSMPAMLQELTRLFAGPTVWGEGRAGPDRHDVLIFGEPFWLAPLVSTVLRRPAIVTSGVSMLLGFPSLEIKDVTAWWYLFHGMMEMPGTHVGVSNLFLRSQGFEQSGYRFTYVPYLGMNALVGLKAPPVERPEVFVFRASASYTQINFVKVLQAFIAASQREQIGPLGGDSCANRTLLRVQSDSWQPTFQEISSFRAAILLPKQVDELKLVDLFALHVITFVPSDPLVHRFIWPLSKPFGIWTPNENDANAILSRSPWSAGENTSFRGSKNVAQTPDVRALSTLSIGKALKIEDDLTQQRFWYTRSEYALLQQVGVQGFGGAAELLHRLSSLQESDAIAIRHRMAEACRVRRRSVLSWWRHAAASVASHALSS